MGDFSPKEMANIQALHENEGGEEGNMSKAVACELIQSGGREDEFFVFVFFQRDTLKHEGKMKKPSFDNLSKEMDETRNETSFFGS